MTMNCYNSLKIWLIAGIFLALSFPGGLFALTGEQPSSAAVGQDVPALTYTVIATLDEDGSKTGEMLGKSETGQTLWAVSHPSAQRGASLHGPVLNGQVWIYALGGDVLELDRDGHVVKRTPYPATIADLRLDGEKVWVTLESQRGSATDSVEVLHTGKSAGSGPWGSFPFVALRLSQDLPINTPETLERDEWEPVISELIAAENIDFTNPILSAYLALGSSILEKDADADAAFSRAQKRSLTWADDMMLCGVLERAQRVELAMIVCARAVARMKDSGIRPEALWSLILVVSTTGDLRKAMEVAIEGKDADSVNRIAGYLRAAFPYAEGAEYAWSSLAEWMADNGASEKARVWKAASGEVISSNIARAPGIQTRIIDLGLLFMAAANLGLVMAGLALGIRAERRKPGTKNWRTWIPTPTLLEAVSLLLFIGATLATAFMASREVALIAETMTMPMSATTDGFAAPEVVTWLDGFETTPMVSELRLHSKQDLEFLKAGLPVSPKPPRVGLALDVVRERAASRAGLSPLAVFTVASDEEPNPLWAVFFMVTTLFNIVFFAAIGRLGARILGPDHKAFLLIPGVASGPLAVWCATAISMGILYVATPLGTVLTSISTPQFARYYGLDGLDLELNLKPDIMAMMGLLALGLTIHIVGVAWQLKKSPTSLKN